MDDVIIIKAADNMDNSICHAYVAQKLISQTLTLGRALYKPCYVNKFNYRRGVLFRIV